MRHEIHSWYSTALDRTMALQVLGHAGARALVFPTILGTHTEWLDRGMDQVLKSHLENGWIQLFCLDQVHSESWYAEHKTIPDRVRRQLEYDRYLVEEVLPFTQQVNDSAFVIAVGADFGAYQAAVFGLRHPTLVHRIIGLSGLYDISYLTDGYVDAAVTTCNPFTFIQIEQDNTRIDAMRRQDIVLAVGRDDPVCGNNTQFSGVLWGRGISNTLRLWEGWAHDWSAWKEMILKYIDGHD